MAGQLSPSREFSIMSAASVTTSSPRAWQAFSKICIFFLSMRYVGCFNDPKSGMSFDSAVSMPRNWVVTTAHEGKGIPSAPPSSSPSSTIISQAWHSPSLVERFQAQLNCAPLPMSLHNKMQTIMLLSGAARNQNNRDGVNREDGEDNNFVSSLPAGTRNT